MASDQAITCPTITTMIPDIIETHILTRLDAQTLAAAACTSSQLHNLSTQQKLWQRICISTWPSSNDPRVQTLVSAYPGSYRSFFSDSFPVPDCLSKQRPSRKHSHRDVSLLPCPTKELISAVDLYYNNDPIFSRVTYNETVTGWFQFPPFRIDLVGAKDPILAKIPFEGEANVLFGQLEKNLTLSWIVIDSSRNRAVNLSSRWPVSVQQDWLTRDLHVKYAVVVAAGDDQRWGLFWGEEFVECEVMVTLGEKGGGGGILYVKEVNMQMRDMNGRNLSGRDSLVILQEVMEKGKRRKRGKRQGQDGKERYEEFVERKRMRKEKKDKKERALDMACICSGVAIFFTLWSFILFR